MKAASDSFSSFFLLLADLPSNLKTTHFLEFLTYILNVLNCNFASVLLLPGRIHAIVQSSHALRCIYPRPLHKLPSCLRSVSHTIICPSYVFGTLELTVDETGAPTAPGGPSPSTFAPGTLGHPNGNRVSTSWSCCNSLASPSVFIGACDCPCHVQKA